MYLFIEERKCDRNCMHAYFLRCWDLIVDSSRRTIIDDQKPIRVETCNGPLCAGKQTSEYSICQVPYLEQQERGVSKYGTYH